MKDLALQIKKMALGFFTVGQFVIKKTELNLTNLTETNIFLTAKNPATKKNTLGFIFALIQLAHN